MNSKNKNYRPYIRHVSVLPLLLFIYPIDNAAFSQATDSNNNFLQMSSDLTSSENNDIPKTNGSRSSLIVKLLSDNLEDYFQNAGAVLNITSQLPQVRNVSFAHLLNQTLNTLHGIPEDADIEKRQVAQNILNDYNNHYQIIIFIMPNGDIYFEEPYARQQISTTTNLGFRDYFKAVIETNSIYLGDPSTSASSGQIQSVIAVPVYSLENNSTLVGVWAGGLDFNVLNGELQSLNLTSLEGNARVVYAGHNGQKIADSDKNRASQVESFANLNSFKNAITNGQSGTVIDTVDDEMMLVTYQPVKAFQNTFVVLLMQANNVTTSN